MTRYACSNPACPRREPVTAEAAPTCYTCAQPMAAAVEAHCASCGRTDHTFQQLLACSRTDDLPVDTGAAYSSADALVCVAGIPAYPPYRDSQRSTASILCDALLAIPGVSLVCLVEHLAGDLEVFADGGHPDAIARCIYDNTWPGVTLRGQETGDVGTGTRVAFSRGAAAAAVASVPPRVRGCVLAGVGGAQ